MTKTTSLVFVLYDGIEHSVFEGQVLAPLLKKLARNKELVITIISFEKIYPSEKKLLYLKSIHPRLHIKLFRKTFFLGWISLTVGAWQLYSYLKKFKEYTLIARGPLAGIIAQKALTEKCTSFIIQARGLLAEEYRFTHARSSFIMKWVHLLRARQLNYWEKQAYSYQATVPFSIEAVSIALKNYLIQYYHLAEHIFFFNHQDDTPKSIKPAQRISLRSTLREKLKIPENAYVYVYNGSAKSWQCPQETVQFFKEQLTHNKNAFLLLLTADLKLFKKICKEQNLPLTSYRIITVSHKNILPYLCTADQGILLREKNIINWVSRPTKYLEYKAAGLPVVHNHTVAFLDQEN